MTENEAKRLTTDKKTLEMGMCELAHNCCYIKSGSARYRDFEMDMDARDFTRNLMTTLLNEDMSVDDEIFDEEIAENLMYDPFYDTRGLIALFYRNMWAMAELRENLKGFEVIGTIEEFKNLKAKSVAKKAICYDKHHYKCPICDEDLGVDDDSIYIYEEEIPNFCSKCGQKLDRN